MATDCLQSFSANTIKLKEIFLLSRMFFFFLLSHRPIRSCSVYLTDETMKLLNFYTKKQKRHHKRNTLLWPWTSVLRSSKLKNSCASIGTKTGLPSGNWNKDTKLGSLPSWFRAWNLLNSLPARLHLEPWPHVLMKVWPCPFYLICGEGHAEMGVLQPKDPASCNSQVPCH